MSLFLWLLLACGKQGATECTYDSDCGDGAICNESGICESVDCLVSDECGEGEFCTEGFQCEEGCAGDGDCDAGELCDDNQCVTYGCRTTELDCALGQFCDTSTGECKSDTRDHCGTCDAGAFNTGCANDEACYILDVGASCNNDGNCDPGWLCDDLGSGKVCHRDYCMLSCNPDAELTCPRGMSCSPDGNKNYCVGDCTYLLDNGYL